MRFVLLAPPVISLCLSLVPCCASAAGEASKQEARDAPSAAEATPPHSNDDAPPQGTEVSNELPPLTLEAFNLGKKLFRKKTCNGCHAIGEFFGKCPDLKGVTKRDSPAWIRRWLADPDEMRKTDPYAQTLSATFTEVMPYLDLEPTEIESLLVYLALEGVPPGK